MRLVHNILVLPTPAEKCTFEALCHHRRNMAIIQLMYKNDNEETRDSQKVSRASTLPVHSHFPLLPRILMSVKKHSDDTLAPTQPAAFLCVDDG